MAKSFLINSSKFFGLQRKLIILCPFEGFFELHSRASEGKEDEEWVLKDIFLAN